MRNSLSLKNVLAESDDSRYSIHLGVTKMYRNLMLLYWCPRMKRNIAEDVKLLGAYLAREAQERVRGNRAMLLAAQSR
ncbi:hypothetical protein MTR67_040216 [Solanum verrucosum]|uniref:Integrase zinc-binding domain-containing protein n=1 Tax=Solanum verrucosum TaxID=315347 RepID=A0AAF0ZPK6_SOLVR|nr:hypothetical protein MTR67_040216 [Solanum verrucosum]